MIAGEDPVSRCEHEESASLYSLGLLDEVETRAFEQHLSSCTACSAEVRACGDLAIRLAESIPRTVPPAELRQRVLAEAPLPRGVAALVRGQRLKWEATPFAGVSISRLYEDPLRGELASLLRMAPGAHYPSHHHAGLEHCYVIEGDLVFEDHMLTAGDYSAGSPDREHSAATSKTGCLLFIVGRVQDPVQHALTGPDS